MKHCDECITQIGSSSGYFEFGHSLMLKQILTRTVWWVVPLIWVPVAMWFISVSYTMGHTLPQVVLMSVLGSFIWTFLEYCFHRFLFHIETKSYWLVLFYFCWTGGFGLMVGYNVVRLTFFFFSH